MSCNELWILFELWIIVDKYKNHRNIAKIKIKKWLHSSFLISWNFRNWCNSVTLRQLLVIILTILVYWNCCNSDLKFTERLLWLCNNSRTKQNLRHYVNLHWHFTISALILFTITYVSIFYVLYFASIDAFVINFCHTLQ